MKLIKTNEINFNQKITVEVTLKELIWLAYGYKHASAPSILAEAEKDLNFPLNKDEMTLYSSLSKEARDIILRYLPEQSNSERRIL